MILQLRIFKSQMLTAMCGHCLQAILYHLVKNLPANAGDIRDATLISGLGRSPDGWCGNPLQYCWQENPMDRGAWWATVHRIKKSQTGLKRPQM